MMHRRTEIGMEKKRRLMKFIVVPDGHSSATRSFEVSYTRLNIAIGVVLAMVSGWVITVASWGIVGARAARVGGLEDEITRLQTEVMQAQELAGELRRLETQYTRVRDLLGANRPDDPMSIWIPGIDAPGVVDTAADSSTAMVPTSWPLTQRGFVTQEHLGEIPGEHPGIDIAIPEGDYIRASGGGVVTEAGEDAIYGKFVRIRHADGYETVYGHASELFVMKDDAVARHQVIALTGNTGSSTAPHLHFEVWKNGATVDPRTVVSIP
jgi:murein DD-endopeptidase MepM/ murein hydrolase activator NlpD